MRLAPLLAVALLACRAAPPAPPPPLARPAPVVDALPAIPAAPIARPAAVAAELSLGDPRGQLTQLALYADQVANGAGVVVTPDRLTALLGELVAGGGSLDGLDLGQPIHLVHVLPADGPPATIAVAAIADEVALDASLGRAGERLETIAHGGRVAIGRRAALAVAAPYALATVSARDAAPNLRGAIYPAELASRPVESFAVVAGALLHQQLGVAPDDLAPLGEALRQIERIDGELTIARDAVSARATLAPRPGSALAAFVARQKPSDFAFVSALRPGPFRLVIAGAIDWGDEALAALARVEVASIFPHALWSATVPRGTLVAGARDLEGGLRAMVSGAGPGAADHLEAWARATAQTPIVADGATTTVRPASLRARGGKFHMVVRAPGPDGGPARAGAIGVVGGSVVRAEGPPGLAGAWVAGRTSADLGPAIEPGVATARAAGESALVLLDLARPGATRGPEDAALSLGAGVAGGALALRATVPAAQLAALMARP